MIRLTRTLHRIFVPAVLLLTGCTGDGLSPAEVDRIASGEPHIPVIGRFEIATELPPRSRVDEPFRITVRATAHLATEEAVIRITLPEVAAARTSGFGPDLRVPVGVPLPPEGEWFVRMERGQTVERSVTLDIPHPGRYRVVATVQKEKESEEPPLHDGRPVQDLAIQERWIPITPE